MIFQNNKLFLGLHQPSVSEICLVSTGYWSPIDKISPRFKLNHLIRFIKTRYDKPLNGDPKMLVHDILDFIVIVAIFTVGDTPLSLNVSPMPEITISPPSRFSVHPIGGKQAGRI